MAYPLGKFQFPIGRMTVCSVLNKLTLLKFEIHMEE